MKWLRVVVLLPVLALLAAWFPHGSTVGPVVVGPTALQSLQTWGGGNVVGGDNSNLSVFLARTDSFGAYLLGTDKAWHQLDTDAAFSTAFCDTPNFNTSGSCFGYFPATGTSQAYVQPGGVIELCAAPSLSTRAYMFQGWVYRTDNLDPANPDNLTWINTNQIAGAVNKFNGGVKTADNSNGTFRQDGRFIACDPINPDHVFVGTQLVGVWETKDAGKNWNQISSSDIPSSLASHNYKITFDPNSGNCSGVTCIVYIYTSSTTPGLYVSTTGGGAGTWSLVAAGYPTIVQHIIAHPTDHSIWLTSGISAGGPANGNLLRYTGGTGGTWTTIATGTAGRVAINPRDTTHVVYTANSGTLMTSTDGGVTFPNSVYTFTLAAGDAPWMALAASNLGALANDIFFTDSNSDLLFFGGQGAWDTAFPTGNFVYTTHVKGIMQPIGEMITVPKKYQPMASFQDIESCTYNIQTIVNPPCNPLVSVKSLIQMTGQSSPNQNYTVGRNTPGPGFGVGADWSGYSTDSFVTNFTPFNTWNAGVPAANVVTGTTNIGKVKVQGISTTSGAVPLSNYSNGQGSILCSTGLSHTTLGNLLNSPAPGFCFPISAVTSTSFEIPSIAFPQSPVPTAGYLFWAPATDLSTWNSTQNITNVDSSGTITYMYHQTGVISNNEYACITGVLGPTEVNGCWIISGVSASFSQQASVRSFTLVGLVPSGIAYAGGGVVTTWQEPGGNIAAADTNNISILAANQPDGPRCTVNAGTDGWPNVPNTTLPPAYTTVNNPTPGATYGAGISKIQIAAANVAQVDVSATTIIQVPMDDGRLDVTQVQTVGGPIVTGTITAAGTLYTNGTYTGVSLTGGTGTGALATVTVSGAVVTAVTITTAGTGYVVNDSLSASAASIGGTGSGFAYKVSTIGTPNQILFNQLAAFTGSVTATTLTVTALASGYISSGLGLNGTSIPAGVTITGFLTGTPGGIGTYSISTSLTIVSEAMTGNEVIPPGRTIADGVNVYTIEHGWHTAAFSNRHALVVDSVSGDFFASNFLAGLYKWHGCNPAVLVNTTTEFDTGPNWQIQNAGNGQLKSALGESGHLASVAGLIGGPIGINNTRMWRTCNGNNNTINGVDMTKNYPGVWAPQRVGFGSPKPGGRGYPSTYMIGWYDPTGSDTEANAVFGWWESTDDLNHNNSGTSVSCIDPLSFNGQITGTALHINSGSTALHVGDGIMSSGATPLTTGTVIVSGSGADWVVNHSQTVSAEAMTAGNTFHSIATWPVAFPNGPRWMPNPSDIIGDPFVYGPVYVNTVAGPFFCVLSAAGTC